MQEQVFLNEAAPARIDAVASDLSLSRKAILQEASYRYLEGLEWQAEIKAGRDDAAQGNIPPADDVERSFSARRSALRAGGLMVRAVWTAHAVRRREEIFDNIAADNAGAACELPRFLKPPHAARQYPPRRERQAARQAGCPGSVPYRRNCPHSRPPRYNRHGPPQCG